MFSFEGWVRLSPTCLSKRLYCIVPYFELSIYRGKPSHCSLSERAFGIIVVVVVFIARNILMTNMCASLLVSYPEGSSILTGYCGLISSQYNYSDSGCASISAIRRYLACLRLNAPVFLTVLACMLC